jgi:hypothetical protein
MQKVMTVALLLAVVGLFLSLSCRQESGVTWQMSPPPSAAGYGSPPVAKEPAETSSPNAATGGYGSPPPPATSSPSAQEPPAAGGYGTPPPPSSLNLTSPPDAGGYGRVYEK